MRSLVVTHTFPWPARGGGAIRAAHTIDALARLGPVDVACIFTPTAIGIAPGALGRAHRPRAAHSSPAARHRTLAASAVVGDGSAAVDAHRRLLGRP